MAFFRKNILWIIGTIIAVIGVFATYDVFYLGRPQKKLQITVDSPIAIVNIRPEAVNDIQLLYKGTPVQNASFLQIRITNIGNQPIIENDYTRPITFSINPNYKLLDVSIANSNPSNLGVLPSLTSDNKVEINKVLFNPNDEVTIRLTTVGDPTESVLSGFSADGRIVGIRELQVITPDKKNQIPTSLLLIAGILAGSILSIAIYYIKTLVVRKRVSELVVLQKKKIEELQKEQQVLKTQQNLSEYKIHTLQRIEELNNEIILIKSNRPDSVRIGPTGFRVEDNSYPREGKLSETVIDHYTSEAIAHSCITISVEPFIDIKSNKIPDKLPIGPYWIELDSAMSRTHAILWGKDGNSIGEIINPFSTIYSNDYVVSLIAVIGSIMKIRSLDAPFDVSQKYNLKDAALAFGNYYQRTVFVITIPASINDFARG